MSVDKRSVTTDALQTLGTIITDGGRDAIHLAVEPVTAAERLLPGQHIGIVDGKATKKATKKLGIVDPFIEDIVMPGEKFWLVVYPRQITSLRHVWEHPDFPTEDQIIEIKVKEPESEKDFSERWIRNFAAEKSLKYDVVMKGAEDYVNYGEYLCFGGLLEGEYVPDEFWYHYEVVTGKKIAESNKGSFFTCSC